jgi:hypothetical protein
MRGDEINHSSLPWWLFFHTNHWEHNDLGIPRVLSPRASSDAPIEGVRNLNFD